MLVPVMSATFAYFAIALACGFVFGALREWLFTPRVGPEAAVLIELPLILAALWIGCGWAVRRFAPAIGLKPRLAMGMAWFVLFLAAEFALGAGLRGWTISETAAHFQTTPGALGLVGFAVAAMFPLLSAK